MRSAPTAVKDWLPTTNVCWRADLVTITLLRPPSGTPSWVRWTTADMDIQAGGNVFTSGPILSRTLRQGCRLEVDTLDLELAGAAHLGGTSLGVAALRGVFDDARVRVDHVIGSYPGDLSLGAIPLWFEGRVSGVDPGSGSVRVTIKSDFEAANIMLPRFLFNSTCGHSVYDVNCGVTKSSFTVTGSVTAVNSAKVFNTSLSGKVDNYYNLGVLAFTSGVNDGVRRAVEIYGNAGGVVTLALPLQVAPSIGNTFTIYPGCSRTNTTCRHVFNNIARFRGFPLVPASEGGQ